jgi:hypothetical protein
MPAFGFYGVRTAHPTEALRLPTRRMALSVAIPIATMGSQSTIPAVMQPIDGYRYAQAYAARHILQKRCVPVNAASASQGL